MRLSDNRITPAPKSRFARLLCVTSFIVAHTFLHADTDSDFALSASPFVTEGYAQLEAGQPKNALIAFGQALEADSNDLSARLGQAMIYAEQERHQDAFSSYDLIVQRYPQHAFAWNGRGLAAFNLEDFDTALTSFQMATVDQPVNGFFYESLAWTQMCRGEFTDAAESAKKASLMYSQKGEVSAYPLLIAYFSYHESGDAKNALRTLNYANKNKPVNQWPAPVIDFLSEKIDESDLISFVTNSAEETEAHTYIGLYLRLLGETDEASQHLKWVSRYGDPQVFEYTLARAINLQNSVAAVVR
jgi:tetratricopeptide (TPR) repeat protein